jgi:hypothetical protein
VAINRTTTPTAPRSRSAPTGISQDRWLEDSLGSVDTSARWVNTTWERDGSTSGVVGELSDSVSKGVG